MYLKADICVHDKCCGCAACVSICPKRCLVMQEDEMGEKRPFIDKNKCIECGLCRKVCQNNQMVDYLKPMSVYAGWRKSAQARVDCSSGGIATALSEWFIACGGVVFGATYNRETSVRIVPAETLETVQSFKGSKYVQAAIDDCYTALESYLKNGRNVLLFSTPCQIQAVKQYLSVRRVAYTGKLFTVDFLCHGVVPERYLLDEISTIEENIGCKTDGISFRSNLSELNYNFTLKKADKIVYKEKAEKQRYFYAFLRSIINRECCNSCKFKCPERVADITLGDFIGLGSKIPFKPADGVSNVSLVMVNTDFGVELLHKIDNEIRVEIRTLKEAVSGGPSLRGGAEVSRNRKKFRKLYQKYGWDRAIDKATKNAMRLELLYKNSLKNARAIKHCLSKMWRKNLQR